jgi:hypothetical protein
MAIDITEAILRVRSFLNEPISVFWSDAELLDWITEGCLDFSSKSLLIEDSLTLPLVAGQIIYTSADVAAIASILEPYACLYNDGLNNWKGIIKMHPRMIGNESVNTPGDPRYYALHHSSIYVWPAPTAAMVVAGAYLNILHAKLTDDIADIHDEYQHIPLLYAKAKAKYKDQKFAEANTLMTLYMSAASFERQDKHGREEDSLDMFKIKAKGGQQGAT